MRFRWPFSNCSRTDPIALSEASDNRDNGQSGLEKRKRAVLAKSNLHCSNCFLVSSVQGIFFYLSSSQLLTGHVRKLDFSQHLWNIFSKNLLYLRKYAAPATCNSRCLRLSLEEDEIQLLLSNGQRISSLAHQTQIWRHLCTDHTYPVCQTQSAGVFYAIHLRRMQ